MEVSATMSKRACIAGSGREGKRERFELGGDAFDCPICSNAMLHEILQCQMGHSICKDCLKQLPPARLKCPTCQAPYPKVPIRNFSLEGLVRECRFACAYSCGFQGKPPELLSHQETCSLKPVKCLVHGCDHRCNSKAMLKHLVEAHTSDGDGTVLMSESHEGHFSLPVPLRDIVFDTALLFPNDANEYVCVHSRRVHNDIFTAMVVHFDAPLRYSMDIAEGPWSLKMTGQSYGIAESFGKDPNIKIPLSMLDEFASTGRTVAGVPVADMRFGVQTAVPDQRGHFEHPTTTSRPSSRPSSCPSIA